MLDTMLGVAQRLCLSLMDIRLTEKFPEFTRPADPGTPRRRVKRDLPDRGGGHGPGEPGCE
jgi:hypothetical protein